MILNGPQTGVIIGASGNAGFTNDGPERLAACRIVCGEHGELKPAAAAGPVRYAPAAAA